MPISGGQGLAPIDVWNVTTPTIVAGTVPMGSSLLIPAGRTIIAVQSTNLQIALNELGAEYWDGTAWEPIYLDDSTARWGCDDDRWTPFPAMIRSDGANLRLVNSDGANDAPIFYIYY